MVSTKSLHYNYQNGPELAFPDFSLEKAGVLLVLGESGKGKTTLLHLLAGLMPPSSGSINIGPTDITGLTGASLDNFRGKNIGVVFQQSLFIKSISVLENLLLAQRLAGINLDKSLAQELLDNLNVGNKASRLPNELSVGERQRASIARALSTSPEIVLADEPTSALDDNNCEKVASLLKSAVTERGASLIIVTHDKRLKNHFPKTIEL